MLVLFLLFLLLLLLMLHHAYHRRCRPPGPCSLPLVGSLPFLTTTRGILDWALDPRVTSEALTSVWLGPLPSIIINCPTLARQLFEKEEFSGRKAPDWIVPLRFSKGAFGILNNTGKEWSAQRRFSLKTFKNFGLGKKSLEESIHFEVMEMIEKCFSGKGDIKMASDFNVPIINVLWQIVAGDRFDLEKPRDASVMAAVRDIFDNGFKTDFTPFEVAKIIPNLSGLARQREVCAELSEFFGEIIEKHKKELDSLQPKDFIDVYLLEADKNGEVYNSDELMNCMWDFLNAGTETSSTTLKWALLYLTIHQDVQERCRREVATVVGGGRTSVADLPNLPFLAATIAEVQRISRVAPFSLPHLTTTATRVGKFNFPPQTTFFANLSFFSHDPEHWHEPHKFKPERFLSDEGRFHRDDWLLPFGVGRRYCMGEQLARSEIFLFLSSLLQHLSFLPPIEHEAPSPERYSASLTRVPDDFYLVVKSL